jgi:hypothetical protein
VPPCPALLNPILFQEHSTMFSPCPSSFEMSTHYRENLPPISILHPGLLQAWMKALVALSQWAAADSWVRSNSIWEFSMGDHQSSDRNLPPQDSDLVMSTQRGTFAVGYVYQSPSGTPGTLRKFQQAKLQLLFCCNKLFF